MIAIVLLAVLIGFVVLPLLAARCVGINGRRREEDADSDDIDWTGGI